MAIIYWIAILTIVRVINSETVDPKEKLRAELSNVKDQLNGMQGDTEDLKKSLDAFSDGLDEYIGTEEAAAGRNAKFEKAKTVVEGALKAIPKFKSGDPGQIISGILDMTSMALTTFGGMESTTYFHRVVYHEFIHYPTTRIVIAIESTHVNMAR